MASRSTGWPRARLAPWLGALAGLLLGLAGAATQAERGPRLAGSAGTTFTTAAALDEDSNAARVIVRYRAGSALALAGTAAGRAQHAARLASRLALPLTNGRVLGQHTQGLHGRGLSSSQLVARLQAQPDVEWAVVDRRRSITGQVPNDPFYGAGQTSITPTVGQWYLRPPDSTFLSAINAEGAWAISTGSSSITVAVLDTGVRFDHPDLAGKLWPGYDFVRDTISADGDGPDADASDPGDWSTASDSCGAHNSSWHGTQVAGLIGAASDNGIGMAGVGRNVMVLPVRVLGKCGGYDTDIIAGMRWAAGLSNNPVANPHKAQVINLSLGAVGTCSSAYRAAIAEITAAGVVVVVAAGNQTGLAVNEPANCPGAIAVAGVRHAGTKVGYSSLGPEVAVAAPAGNCVNDSRDGPCLYPLLTTDNAGSASPGANVYSSSSNPSLGTSFASPLVAGTAALMLSANPALTPAQVKAALQATARRFPTTGAQANGTKTCAAPNALEQVECYCTTSTCGAGLLDSAAAVARAAATTLAPVAVIARSTDQPTTGTAVFLDGAPSSVSAKTYQWAITEGASLAQFAGSTAAPTATLTMQSPGKVVASLTVTDNENRSNTSSQTLNPTLAPTAVLLVGTDKPTVSASVSLDGSNSPAAIGRSIASYLWSLSFPSVATTATITSATNASRATVVGSAPGDVTVKLTVTDNLGDSRSTTQTISFGAAPIARIASGTDVAVGASLALSGQTSSAATGHNVSGYGWSITSGAGLANFSGATDASSAILSAVSAGTVVVRLTVFDEVGGSATAEQTVTVAAAPVVVSSSGGGGGAMGAEWLLGLALAAGLLSWRRP